MNTAKQHAPQINIFIAYAKKDYKLQEELRKHLSLASRARPYLKVYDEYLMAGEDKAEILNKLENANIIIILVSSDFVTSEYCWEVLLQKALEKNKADEDCWIVPVIIREYDKEYLPFKPEDFLPKNAIPFEGTYWKDNYSWEKPYVLVVQGTKRIAEGLMAKFTGGDKAGNTPNGGSVPLQAQPPKTGKVLYRIPATMQMGKMQKCVVRIAPDEVGERKLFERLKSANWAKLEKGIELGEVMKVELEDSNQAFDVKLVGGAESREQKISNFGFTEWRFEVTPLKPGTHTLYMRVSIAEHLDKHGKKYHNSITLDKEIKVKTQPLAQEEEATAWEEHRKSIPYRFGDDPASRPEPPGPREFNPLRIIRGAARFGAACMVLPLFFALSLSASPAVRQGWAEILHRDYTVCYETTLTDQDGNQRIVTVVEKDGKMGYLNKYGKTLAQPVYDDIKPSGANGKTLVKKDGKWGVLEEVPKSALQMLPILGNLVENEDQLVAPPVYDEIREAPSPETGKTELKGSLQGKDVGKIPLRNPKKLAVGQPSPISLLGGSPQQLQKLKEADSLMLSGNKAAALQSLQSLEAQATSPEEEKALGSLINERSQAYRLGREAVEELSEQEFAELLYGLGTPQATTSNGSNPKAPSSPLVAEVPQIGVSTAGLLTTLKPASLSMDAADIGNVSGEAQRFNAANAAALHEDAPSNAGAGASNAATPETERLQTALAEARRLMEEGQYAHARARLQAYKTAPEAQTLLDGIAEREQAAEKAAEQAKINAALEEARKLLGEKRYDAALSRLKPYSQTSDEARQLENRTKAEKSQAELKTGLQKADALKAAGQYTEARAAYQNILDSHPGNAHATQMMAELEALKATNTTPPNTGTPSTDVINDVSPSGSDLPDPIQELISNMVYVAGGTFMMGCTAEQGEDCEADEKPAHEVTLSSYHIGKYEVTQAQWRAVMGSNPPELAFPGCDACPVEKVSWNDVQEFLAALNKKTGKSFRLPTEAEWEYAARGGSQSGGTKYAGSNNIDAVAWYYGNSNNKTHPVGQKQANTLGLYDMNGNVNEWCADWYGSDYYGGSPAKNPRGPSTGNSRVLRGGSWFNNAEFCRAAHRYGNGPNFRGSDYGFRPAHSLE